jgi:hypothetical protein
MVLLDDKLTENGRHEAWIVKTDVPNKCRSENFSSIYIYWYDAANEFVHSVFAYKKAPLLHLPGGSEENQSKVQS